MLQVNKFSITKLKTIDSKMDRAQSLFVSNNNEIIVSGEVDGKQIWMEVVTVSKI